MTLAGVSTASAAPKAPTSGLTNVGWFQYLSDCNHQGWADVNDFRIAKSYNCAPDEPGYYLTEVRY
jgi:hypothetical protein